MLIGCVLMSSVAIVWLLCAPLLWLVVCPSWAVVGSVCVPRPLSSTEYSSIEWIDDRPRQNDNSKRMSVNRLDCVVTVNDTYMPTDALRIPRLSVFLVSSYRRFVTESAKPTTQ